MDIKKIGKKKRIKALAQISLFGSECSISFPG